MDQRLEKPTLSVWKQRVALLLQHANPSKWKLRIVLLYVVTLVALIAFVELVVLSHVFGWTWTGFQENGTLWDWLNLFMLPIAVAVAPIWLKARASWRLHIVVLAIVLAVLMALVVGGYFFGWTWTGFPQNGTLWAWLNLFMLPIVLAVLPIWIKAQEPWNIVVPAIVLAVLMALVVGGYFFGWTWTGFQKNGTLWNWITLLLLPLIVLAFKKELRPSSPK